ncbi:MAG: hypothetical protein J0L81_17260 [Caulobacterales bacterium]|jgi:hypothetical protein|nr:hypothetical protein [Caulobacterales bacterium]
MRLLATVAIAALLAACGQQATPPEPIEPPVTEAPAPLANAITSDGWNTLRVGMTRAEVTAAVGATATPGAVGGPDPAACDLFHPAYAPEGMLVMIQQDLLTSIILRNNTTLRTDRGFGVGSSAAEIKTAYGASAVSEPHKYVEGAEYITIWSVGGPSAAAPFVEDTNARGVRYETNAQGIVTAVHAGGPSIQNVEGCS